MSELAGKSLDQTAAVQEQVPAKRATNTQPGGGYEAVLALQRAAGNSAVAALLGGSSGKPLDAGTREAMESKFGEDFGKVRLHTGEAAARVALGAGARAFTSGRDIVFGEGFYSPSTTQGKRLIAHELAHVIQQGRTGGRSVSSTAAESEARQAGASVAGGENAVVQAQAGSGALADPLSEDEIRKQIADNEASVANAATPEQADALFKERESLQQQLGAAAAPSPAAPAAPPPPEQVQAPPAPAAAAPKVVPFDPQAGNPFVKWLLYRNDTPVLDALTNDQNLKVAQDVAAGVAITAGTIATGGLLAEAAAGAGAGAVTAGAIGGAGGSTASVALKSAYKQELPTAQEAITEIGVGALTGGVGGGLGGAAAKAGLGKIASGAIGGAGGAATQTAANAAITGKAPTAGEALKDVAVGAAFGGAFSAADTALGKLSTPSEPIPGAAPVPEAPQSPTPETPVAETQAPVPEAQSLPPENAVAEPQAPVEEGQSPVPESAVAEAQTPVQEELQSPASENPAAETQTPAAEEPAPVQEPTGPSMEGLIDNEEFANDPNIIDRLSRARELDIGGYKSLTGEGEYGRRGDSLDSDEALQNAKIRMEKGVERNSAATKDNPAIALRPQLHRQIRNLKAPQLENLSPNEVLQQHLEQMKDFVPEYILRTLEAESQGFIGRTFGEPPQAQVETPAPPAQVETPTPQAQAETPVPETQAETTAPEANMSVEPPQGRLRFENGQLVNYDAPQSQAETTASGPNMSVEPPQQRLRFDNGELVSADAPRVRVDTTPQPDPADYLEPEQQSSEQPLKKMFLRRDQEGR